MVPAGPWWSTLGLPSTARLVTELLETRGAAPAVVVATHGHADHVGGLLELGGCIDQVALPVRIRDYLDGEAPRSPSLGQVASIAPVLRDQPFTPGPRTGCVRSRCERCCRDTVGRSSPTT